MQLDADPGDLSPWGNNSVSSLRAKACIYQPLVEYRSDGELHGVLLESWEQTDPTHYTLHLRENVKMHNGDILTASDVLFCIQMAAESSAFVQNTKGINLEESQVVDDQTLILAYDFETVFAMENLARISITTKNAYDSDPDHLINNPVGSGPYKLDDWVSGTSLTMTKFDEYWGDPATEQRVDTILYRIITEPSQRTIELETGGVDVLYDLQSSDVEQIQSNPEFTVLQNLSTRICNLYFNCSSNSVCENKQLRQAIAYAIDSEAIAEVAFGGFAEPEYALPSPVYPEWKESYREQGVLYAQDLDQAKALLAEAGYADGLTLEIITDEDTLKIRTAEIIQAALSEIGITVNITSYESAVFQSTLVDAAAGWDLCVNYCRADGTVLAIFNNQLDANNSKRTFIQDETLQSQIEDAVKDGAEEKVEALLETFNDLIPMYPLVAVEEIYAYKSTISDFNVKVGSLLRREPGPTPTSKRVKRRLGGGLYPHPAKRGGILWHYCRQ